MDEIRELLTVIFYSLTVIIMINTGTILIYKLLVSELTKNVRYSELEWQMIPFIVAFFLAWIYYIINLPKNMSGYNLLFIVVLSVIFVMFVTSSEIKRKKVRDLYNINRKSNILRAYIKIFKGIKKIVNWIKNNFIQKNRFRINNDSKRKKERTKFKDDFYIQISILFSLITMFIGIGVLMISVNGLISNDEDKIIKFIIGIAFHYLFVIISANCYIIYKIYDIPVVLLEFKNSEKILKCRYISEHSDFLLIRPIEVYDESKIIDYKNMNVIKVSKDLISIIHINEIDSKEIRKFNNDIMSSEDNILKNI